MVAPEPVHFGNIPAGIEMQPPQLCASRTQHPANTVFAIRPKTAVSTKKLENFDPEDIVTSLIHGQGDGSRLKKRVAELSVPNPRLALSPPPVKSSMKDKLSQGDGMPWITQRNSPVRASHRQPPQLLTRLDHRINPNSVRRLTASMSSPSRSSFLVSRYMGRSVNRLSFIRWRNGSRPRQPSPMWS